jgi:molecular chaperone DnaK
MSLRTVGIDLGTTNSCVATVEHGEPRIITNHLGDPTTPSVVTLLERDAELAIVVGVPAKRAQVTHPENTIFGVKRLIGRRYDDPEIRELSSTLPYQLVAAPNGDAWVQPRGLAMSPPEVSALILAELRQVADHHFGAPVGEAIITVPSHFDNEQRRATRHAAEIAGLKVRRLLNEPTAAALGYGAHRGADRRVAVCDLGGGTFDVSIVNVERGVIEVISTTGDLFLGGEDFDRIIVERLVAEVARQGADVGDDPQALSRLKQAAQDAKHHLSAAREADIDLRYLASRRDGKPLDFKRLLRRDELESWVQPVVDRLSGPCREAVAGCGLTPRDVDAIILVGGMTRMPLVQNAIATIFGRPPLKVVNPDEIVSVGAAIQCAILDGSIEDVVLLDVTSRAIGMQTPGGKYQQVVPRNAAIPTREHKIIATTRDGQRELELDVFEGESADVADNRHLGHFMVSNLSDGAAGEVMVVVDFTVDVDGILRVSAAEMGSQNRPELRLKATAGLSRADVDRLRRTLPLADRLRPPDR